MPKGYKFFRNVRDAPYRATGNGGTDDTEAINAAILDGNRCGEECGNTFSMPAIIYFPVSNRIIQNLGIMTLIQPREGHIEFASQLSSGSP